MFEGFRLHGEQPLSQRSVASSSNAYDRNLLSRIGKPHSPPRNFSSSPVDATSRAELPFHSKRPTIPSLSIGDGSFSNHDPVSRWINSPPSTAVSPASRPWKDYDFPRLSVDSNATSSVAESDLHASRRGSGRLSNHGSLSIPFDDQSSMASRSNRGSYDHGIFSENDSDYPREEMGQMRQLNLGDYARSRSPDSRQSLKRRASSPPRDAVREDRQSLSVGGFHGESYSRRSSGHQAGARSPNIRYQNSHGSISSVSSASNRNGSYASSAGLSVGASSITTASTHYDRNVSPGGHSPCSDMDSYHESQSAAPSSHIPSPHTSLATSANRNVHIRSAPEAPPQPTPATQMTILPDGQILGPKLPSGAQRIGGQFMCDCCPKKPKKFNNAEDLR